MTKIANHKPGNNRLENGSQVLFHRRHGLGGDRNDKNLQKFHEKEKESSVLGDPVGHIKNLIKLIDDIKIDPEYQEDPEQKKIFKKKKDQAKKLIFDVLIKIGEYLNMIARMGNLKSSESEYQPHDFRKRYEEIDRLRKINHEALMSNINIANRFVAMNFGQINDEMIEEWESREVKAGRPIAYVQRIKLPGNIVCPDQINMDNRDQIRKWAEQIGSCLSELKNEL